MNDRLTTYVVTRSRRPPRQQAGVLANLVILAACALGAHAQAPYVFTNEEIEHLLPSPEMLGEGWQWINPDNPTHQLGATLSAFYHYDDPQEVQNDSPIADVRTMASATAARTRCEERRELLERNRTSVVEAVPELGPSAYSSYYGPHEQYGKRVTFCYANVFVSVSPSHHGLEIAKAILARLENAAGSSVAGR